MMAANPNWSSGLPVSGDFLTIGRKTLMLLTLTAQAPRVINKTQLPMCNSSRDIEFPCVCMVIGEYVELFYTFCGWRLAMEGCSVRLLIEISFLSRFTGVLSNQIGQK
jgi:hypothetical protein